MDWALGSISSLKLQQHALGAHNMQAHMLEQLMLSPDHRDPVLMKLAALGLWGRSGASNIRGGRMRFLGVQHAPPLTYFDIPLLAPKPKPDRPSKFDAMKFPFLLPPVFFRGITTTIGK